VYDNTMYTKNNQFRRVLITVENKRKVKRKKWMLEKHKHVSMN